MSIGFRRFFYLSAITIFLLAAPAIVLYTAGYRYDFKKKQIQLTGSLYIKTLPTKVDIYLNDQLVGTRTPFRSSHLLPNQYEIKIKKDGYDTWMKKLEILPGKGTYAENIILWPQNNSKTSLASAEKILTFTVKNDRSRLIWQNEQGILLTNLLNNQTEKILTLPSSTKVQFIWSADHAKTLIKQNNNYWVLIFSNPLQIINLNEKIKINPTVVKFHPRRSDQIHYLTSQGLFSYHLVSQNNQEILTAAIQDFVWTENRWYYITRNKENMLTYFDTTATEKLPPLFQLPEDPDYEFVAIIKNQALVYQPDELTLYIFNLNPEQFNNTSQIIKPVVAWDINQPKNKLLLHNDWEIWLFDLENQTSEIITRVSQSIQKTNWYRDNNYITIQYQDRLDILELDRRDNRNRSILIDNSEISKMLTSQNGQELYYLEITAAGQQINQMNIAQFPNLEL